MTISVTEQAASQIARQLQKRGHGLGLRVGVKKAGCTGYSYVIEYADDATEADELFEQHGVCVVINRQELPLLEGVTIDFRREGIQESFRFDNPNVKATCGCGESFAV